VICGLDSSRPEAIKKCKGRLYRADMEICKQIITWVQLPSALLISLSINQLAASDWLSISFIFLKYRHLEEIAERFVVCEIGNVQVASMA
jgi:hypothetical protein